LIGGAPLRYRDGMSGGLRIAALAAGLAACAIVAWLVLGRGAPIPRSEPPSPAAADRAARDAAAHQAPVPRPRTDVPAPAAEASGEVDEFDGDALAAAWASVDLDEVRRALPDNIYWEMAAPTTDPAVVEARAEQRRRWNVEYGKVLSGTASEAEIRAYYDQRARLSADYVEFTTHLLDHYGEQIPERDVGFIQLARRLHLARLEEIPRQVQDAFERKRQQDEARAKWLADEAAFRDDAPPPAAD
jgi:hypothetical protein